MFKKIIAVLLFLILVLNCAGCSGAWRKKFIRKKKPGQGEEPVLQPKDYSKEFTNKQLYANHFAFWKSSETELIRCLKDEKGQKRIKTYASYSETELSKLCELLTDEKKKELRPLLDELNDIISKITQPHFLDSNRNMMTRTLKKHHRTVDREFSYYKMKKHIIPDEGEAVLPPEVKAELKAAAKEKAKEEAKEEAREAPPVKEEAQETAPVKEEARAETAESAEGASKENKTLEGVTDFDISELNAILEKYDIEPYKPSEAKTDKPGAEEKTGE